MTVQEQIDRYLADQPQPKRDEMQQLHRAILNRSPGCKLWFLDGRNGENKIVSNPNIGYGSQTIDYASGETKEFYRIGLSANTTGISVYVMGLNDKKYLVETYGGTLGKARITGYCVKFRSLRDMDIDVLEAMIASTCTAGRRTARDRPNSHRRRGHTPGGSKARNRPGSARRDLAFGISSVAGVLVD